ncbi:sigma-70 family RNA polymerase sigma factor, partial [Kitasatospora sp. LaBMicrA B282]
MNHRPDPPVPPAPSTAFEGLRDGLYTYCLSVLCDLPAALAALDETRELAAANAARLTDPGLRRAWHYAVARYACLRRLGAGTEPLATGSAATEPLATGSAATGSAAARPAPAGPAAA